MKTLSEADIDRIDPATIVDLDLGGAKLRQDAYRGLLAHWGSHAPFYVVNNGLPQAVVGRHADVKEVLADRERFTVQPPRAKGYERFDFFNGNFSLSQTDGAIHDRVRSIMMPSFSPRFMTKVEEKVDFIIDRMLDEVEARGGKFDAMNDFANHLIVRILLDGLLGMSPEQQAAAIRMADVLELVTDIPPGGAFPEEYRQAEQNALQVVAEMVADRRANPRELDFVSAMVQAQADSGVIDDVELISNVFVALAAQGTTATTTGAMLMNLCRRRDQFDQIIADRSLIPQVIEECLRYQGPGYFVFPRFALHDCEVGGVKILEGMPVNVSMAAANYDPTVYPEPEKFDIHRNPHNIMTFGTGVHLCLGNRLARQAMTKTLNKVCDRFPNLSLQDPDFVPYYGGMFGELKPQSIPMHTGC